MFTQICLAIKHLHDRKILHRDLKSQNIFLTQAGIVKLGDFGIAKVLSHTKENVQTIVGTPYYLSPEIVENQPYNQKSDIWSLGILLYEMCALEPPFNGTSLHMLALRIVKANYKQIPKRYSSKLSLLIRRLLNPNTKERPSINKILKIDFIAQKAKELMDESEYIQEFSHTVLHNKNIFKDWQNQQTEEVKQQQSNISAAVPPSEKSHKLEERKMEKAKSERVPPKKPNPTKYGEDPMSYISNVIGDLKDKHILEATGDIKPMKKKTPSEKSKKRAPKTSQWEIREQLAQKKREQILNEVRRKREREEEQRLRAERKKEHEAEVKEKERTERARKRELDRQRMRADLKKRMAKPAKSGMEFEFIGVTCGDDAEEQEDQKYDDFEESKDESPSKTKSSGMQ